MVLIVLLETFFLRIFDFFRHWYVKSYFIYLRFLINFFLKIEKKIGLILNLKLIFKPLYQDYSIFGYFFGFIFRSLRLIISIIIYLFLFIFLLILYVLWLILPIFLIINILK